MGPESRKVDYMINKLELATTDGGVALWKTPVPGRGPCLLLSSVCLSFGQRFWGPSQPLHWNLADEGSVMVSVPY